MVLFFSNLQYTDWHVIHCNCVSISSYIVLRVGSLQYNKHYKRSFLCNKLTSLVTINVLKHSSPPPFEEMIILLFSDFHLLFFFFTCFSYSTHFHFIYKVWPNLIINKLQWHTLSYLNKQSKIYPGYIIVKAKHYSRIYLNEICISITWKV